MSYNAKEILEQLDNAAEEFEFPMRDNMSYYPADIKMNVYVNNDEWLIIIQEIAYSIKDHMFINTVFGYGNKLETYGVIDSPEIIFSLPDNPFFIETDSDVKFNLNLLNFNVIIKDIPMKFEFNVTDYKQIDIDLNDTDMPDEAKFIRILSHNISDRLFFSQDEIFSLLNKHFSDYDILLELTNWQNPDLANDELPSDVECFKSLALAIESRDKNIYQCAEEDQNIHWLNWEWYRDYV